MNVLVSNIESLIPQRRPFVMIGNLLYNDAALTRSNFFVDEKNVLVNNGYFTEAGLVENIAQTAAARAGYKALNDDKLVQVGYIGAINDLQIFKLPAVNDELVTEVSVINEIFNVSIISGQVWCNDILIAKCEMKIFIT